MIYMSEIKKIGVLTSGGDSSGMNAAIRAVVRAALSRNIETIGIQHGYAGLLAREFKTMDSQSVSGIMNLGGTILRTSRSAEFETEAGIQKAVNICREIGMQGLVAIGGDGTFRGARDLSLAGVPCVGLPGTIDNDISSSEYTIGFDTAVNDVRDAIEKLNSTIFSHDRCFLIEVMGHNSGDIALHAGIACGAIAILVPEVQFNLDEIIQRVKHAKQVGKHNFIIVVSEGVTKTKYKDKMSVFEMAKKIQEATGINSRADIMGYLQRGGTPTTRERVVASEMGYYAVELLDKGIGNRVVALRSSVVVDLDIFEALAMKKPFNRRLYDIANEISF